MDALHDLLQTTLRKTFGLSHFRKGQLEAITTLMTQGRALCILPTGYGKSLLYQLPASLLPGITIVISPLLALMRDQIDHLKRRFGIPALAINSDQSDEENAHARQEAYNGKIKILFIAPEQLDHVDRFDFLLQLNVKLVVVDEAHCISTWGHDFRPSYRQIIHFLHAVDKKSQDIKILGLTATANKRVEDDIRKQLFFNAQEGLVLRQAMDRPNISLSVIRMKGIVKKLAACEELLNRLEGCGLIYCATRENTEMVAEYLQEQGLDVASYHAGYAVEEKKELQQEFIHDQYKALVATNALGMGIDKGNLRFIIHFDFPGSITAYYQEVGRCGRDGQPAQGIMLFDPSDGTIHNYFIDSALPSENDFQQILETVANSEIPLGQLALKTLTGLHQTRLRIVIAELMEQVFLEKFSLHGKQVYRRLPRAGKPDLSRYEIQQTVKRHELKQIIKYGELADQCRMDMLRNALGDELTQPCGHCDCCLKTNHSSTFSNLKLPFITSWIDTRPPSKNQTARGTLANG
ncbi:MAG TPA: ATP-dependent DNA helicase RecQ [Parachlamydiaceae bacterium]|nr:ATP-dependent DNA helicase RecQ [Parachlamydiaceae bacterium]